MLLQIRRSLILCIIFIVLCGIAYPLIGTGIAQSFFHYQANGEITKNGSNLIGQNWTGPKWFQGRPDNDNPMASGPSNLGSSSNKLKIAVQQKASQLKKEGIQPTPDLVTTSGSGLDPDISPQDAYAQVNAVSHYNHISPQTVLSLVKSEIQQPQLGFLGSQYINVLELNTALYKLEQSKDH